MPLQVQPLPIKVKQGRVFMQRTELKPYFLLENHGLTGVNWPAAALTQIGAQSKIQRTGSDVIDLVEGDVDLATFTLPTRLRTVNNYLASIAGEYVNIQLLTGPNGEATQYGGASYGLAWILAKRQTATTDAAASVDNRGEDAPAGFEVPFAAVMGPLPIDWSVALQQIAITEVYSLNGLAVLPTLKSDDNARRVLPGEVVFACADGDGVGSTANVIYTKDGFRTAHSTMAVDPFGADIFLIDVVAYGDKKAPRVIVAADTQAGAAAQINFTDDYGATWNGAVNLGSTNADQANRLWVVDASHVYGFGGQAGSSKLWESNDGAANWTETDPSLSQPLNDGEVMGNGFGITVGDSNVIARALNFNDWAAITGPSGGAGDDLLCVGIKPNTGTVFIGNDAGELYASQDQGDTWVAATTRIQGLTATAINHISFDVTGEFGFMVITTASTVDILRTTDGGQSWKQYSLSNAGVANIAINKLVAFGPNNVMGCGEATGGFGTFKRAYSNFDGGRNV